MNRSIRLIQPVYQSIRTPALRSPRPNFPSFRQPIPGPSNFRSRTYATLLEPASASASSPHLEQAEAIPDAVDEALLERQSAEQVKERSISMAVDDLELPPNVRFEGFAPGEGVSPVKNLGGPILHSQTEPDGPINLPLSSLASTTPTLAGPSGEHVILPPAIFAQPLRRDILHRCVVWFLSTLRQGTQSTKSRSTVAYSGKKLRPQKGSGRARMGDAGSGIRRGGAPIHPISPRDHAQLLPRKVRALGLSIALSSKLSSGLLKVVSNLNEPQWDGTNAARRALTHETTWTRVPGEDFEEAEVTERFGTTKDLSILFVQSPLKGRAKREAFERTVRNIDGVEVLRLDELQVYHVLKYKWCVMEQEVVELLGGAAGLEDMMGEGFEDVEEADVSALEESAPEQRV